LSDGIPIETSAALRRRRASHRAFLTFAEEPRVEIVDLTDPANEVSGTLRIFEISATRGACIR
jgi:hypothetical protein